jgi:hypothetical protein
MVIRSIETKRLILQANGGGGAGLIIDSANNTTIAGDLSIGNINFRDYSYIKYPNAIYFQNTTASKTISMTAGNLNVPENINVSGYINLATVGSTSYITFANKWFIGVGTANGIPNSLAFEHVDGNINSLWWFNGTQTSTRSEISDERVKKQIENIENPLNKFMLLKPKEYYLCDDKDYNKKLV